MDFTLRALENLLAQFQNNYDEFYSLKSVLLNETKSSSICILRHDVDRLSQNALKIAVLENSLGMIGSYYFRIVPESFNIEIIEKIVGLGHEIGYHYEDIDLVIQKSKVKRQKLEREELIDLAYESFCLNLKKMREVAEIKTICMHGSPRSKFDNKLIWSHRDAFGKKYDYKDLGIIGEPYFDIDFNEFAYFTDTGRKWNGNRVSVRDKVDSKFKFDFKTTQDIIDNIDRLPEKVMFTIHPERWTDEMIPWVKQLVMQNVKNVVKRVIIN